MLLGKHIFGTHVFKLYLSNEAPLATDAVKADIADITAQNGYTAGGEDAQLTIAEAAGTATVTGTKIVWTAAGGSFGPLQYLIIYNDTQTSPLDALVLWWDYGSAISINDGETLTVLWDGGDPTGDVLTLA